MILRCMMIISTHTPVRVWLHTLNCGEGFQDFNSHTREGVTSIIHFPFIFVFYFNSHTREGVTKKSQVKILYKKFQLTHPWGCDAPPDMGGGDLLDFNSHTREGVTYSLNTIYSSCRFQLTHPWGCDLTRRNVIRSLLFQLTHPWGCDYML